jgi:hypothetical protein
MVLNTFQTTVYSLVERYVARQTLVRDAMSDLRPDLLVVAKDKDSYEHLIQMTKLYSQVPQSGQWGNNKEWGYFIHGRGTRLTHAITQEPIEWDAPDIRTFDGFWFLNYLQWLLHQDTGDETISSVKSWLSNPGTSLQDLIFDILNQLVQKGLLVRSDPSNPNKYTLISADSVGDQ